MISHGAYHEALDRPVLPPTKLPLILIVEDEMILAMLLEDHLHDLGYESIKAARVATALPIADQAPLDAAILDVNLGGELSYPIAFALRRRGIPLLFITGYGRAGLAAEFHSTPVLGKPYTAADLAKALAAIMPEGNSMRRIGTVYR